ncbi:hypothetical protein M1D97_11705 [Kushneria sp. AK178]
MNDLFTTDAVVAGVVVLEGDHVLAGGRDEQEAMTNVPSAWQASPALKCVPASMTLVHQVRKYGSVPFVVVEGVVCTIDDADALLESDETVEVPGSPEVERLLQRSDALVADNDEADAEHTG